MSTQKEKKPSIEDLAKERIVNLYRYTNKKLLLVCQAAIKGKPVNLFAALDKTGITLYEYKETYENKVKQLETHSWAEWNEVLIDHYFIKSTYEFTGNNGSWSISFTSNGKEAQQIITNYTDLNIQVVSRPLYRKVLGFRSWKTGKMITAIAMYVAILFIITNEFTSEKTAEKLASLAIMLESLALLGLVIGLIKPKYVYLFLLLKTEKELEKFMARFF